MSNRHLLDKAIAELRRNDQQFEAVHEHGHCVVLAGPGSGKTKTLTVAMARALLEDVQEPRGIACITYNNECALELESRLGQLGVEPSEQVFIGTVHSFAVSQVIAPYARCVLPELSPGFRVATTTERRSAVRTAYDMTIADGGDPLARWRFAEEKRRRDVDRDAAEWSQTNPELALFIEAYEEELRRQNLIDFDDMPLLAFLMIKANPWIGQALVARFPILFVDEYQDLGHALHELVLKLCFQAGMRLFAVGDPDQSIYRWTGANPQLLVGLTGRPGVCTIRLRFNYRCCTRIIDASMAALGEEGDYEAPEGTREGEIHFRAIDGDLDAQADHVVQIVRELIEDAIPLDEIAVLYRTADEGTVLSAHAQEAGIPVVRSDKQALVRRNSRLSRLIENSARWVAGGWKNADPPFARLAREATGLVFGSWAADEERRLIAADLAAFLHQSIGRDCSANLWLRESKDRLIEPWKHRARTVTEEWDAIDEMISRTDAGAQDCTVSLAQLGGIVEQGGRLNLSTLHSAKGREFDHVVLFGMNSEVMPDWRDVKKKNQPALREARRLFYVGVTRARRSLFLVFQKGHHSPWVRELYDRVQ